MKSFIQYITERGKTPLSGQAREEWPEMKGAAKRGDIPQGFTRKNFSKQLMRTPREPHKNINWRNVSNTDAGKPGLNNSKIKKLYQTYKDKPLNRAVLSKDASIIVKHGSNNQHSTLVAGNTRAMLGGKVKRINVGGRRYK